MRYTIQCLGQSNNWNDDIMHQPSDNHVTCPIRVKKAATTDGFPWMDSPTLSPSDILQVKKDDVWRSYTILYSSVSSTIDSCKMKCAYLISDLGNNFNNILLSWKHIGCILHLQTVTSDI